MRVATFRSSVGSVGGNPRPVGDGGSGVVDSSAALAIVSPCDDDIPKLPISGPRAARIFRWLSSLIICEAGGTFLPRHGRQAAGPQESHGEGKDCGRWARRRNLAKPPATASYSQCSGETPECGLYQRKKSSSQRIVLPLIRRTESGCFRSRFHSQQKTLEWFRKPLQKVSPTFAKR